MKTISLVIKEIKIFVRDPLGLIMLFLLPALIILAMGYALNGSYSLISGTGDKKIKMIVLDESGGEYSSNLLTKLHSIEIFEIIEEYSSREEATQALFKKIAAAAIIIPEDFDSSIFLKNKSKIDVMLDPVLSSDTVSLFMRELDKLTLNMQIMALAHKNNKLVDVLSDMDDIGYMIMEESELGYINTDNDEVTSGLSLNEIYVSNTGQTVLPNIVQQTVPGWTIFGLFWIAQILALNIVQERKSGVYKRILISPVSQTTYLIGKLIPFLGINMIQAIFLFTVGRFVLPLLGCPILLIPNIPAIFIISVCISFSALGLGFLFSSLCRSSLSASAVSTIVLLFMTITGGIMVPTFVMPNFLVNIGKFFPHHWALEAYQNILVRQGTLADSLIPISVLLVFGLFYSVLSILISKKQKVV